MQLRREMVMDSTSRCSISGAVENVSTPSDSRSQG